MRQVMSSEKLLGWWTGDPDGSQKFMEENKGGYKITLVFKIRASI